MPKNKKLPFILCARWTALLGLILAGAAFRGLAAQDRDATYWNARFGFSIRYPETMFIPRQKEAADGDGQRFTSKDGTAELLVYGSYNTLNQTLAQILQEDVARHGGKTTLQKQGQDFFVLSGTEGDAIFLDKHILRKETLYVVRVRYPRSARALFDPIADQIVNSLRDAR